MKILVIALPLLLLFSCSSFTPMGIATKLIGAPSGGLDVEANIGSTVEKEESVVALKGEETTIKAERIEGGINKTTIQEVPMEFMLLMLLGWVLPSPGEMWRGFLKLLPWRRDK